MAKWNDLPPSDIAAIITAYESRQSEILDSYAMRLGIKSTSLERYARFYQQYIGKHFIEAQGILETKKKNKTFIKLPSYDNSPLLTDIREVDPETDAMEWLSWLHDNAINDIQVMHGCDVHIPFQDDRAVDLYMQVMKATKPNLIVAGSDFGDFLNLTSFDIDPDETREDGSDVLGVFEEYWNRHINAIKATQKRRVPIVFIYGNHEMRLIRYLQHTAPQMRHRLMRDFISIVRHGGDVWYIGNVDHVRVGTVRIEHGARHNEHVAKSRLIDEGGQVSIWMGHVHKENAYTMRGADYTVKAKSSGALCLREPHYIREGQSTQSGRKWTQGTIVGTWNLSERPVSFEEITFDESGYDLKCWYRGKRLFSESVSNRS